MDGLLTAADERWEEYYCRIGEEIVGVCDSKEGPKLYFNRDMYRLNEECWDVEIVAGKNQHLFTFYWKGEAIRSFRFSQQLDVFMKLYQMLPVRGNRAAAQ